MSITFNAWSEREHHEAKNKYAEKQEICAIFGFIQLRWYGEPFFSSYWIPSSSSPWSYFGILNNKMNKM